MTVNIPLHQQSSKDISTSKSEHPKRLIKHPSHFIIASTFQMTFFKILNQYQSLSLNILQIGFPCLLYNLSTKLN